MINYRVNPRNGDKLSALGFGAMRLPKLAGDKKKIDVEESKRIIRIAYENGVNYYDTAYIYDGSEEVLGAAVKPFRKEIKLATKLPLRGTKSKADFDKLFYTSLKRLDTDYIDYYLIHNIMSYSQYEHAFSLGLADWIAEKKASGEIINIGFSSHAGHDDFVKILDAYDWEFCQIQYNYVDVNFQAGRDGLQYAEKKGLPVIIMEPLRGGALVNKLPKNAEKAFNACNPALSNADWGLKWLYNQPEVSVVLSGMNSEEMVLKNIDAAGKFGVGEMKESEFEAYEKVRAAIVSEGAVPCTGCGYCTPCPKGVNIPVCFSCYNSRKLTGYFQALGNYISATGGLSDTTGYASQCVGCGLCEKKCPQSIPIRANLKKIKKYYEIPLLKPLVKAVKKIVKL